VTKRRLTVFLVCGCLFITVSNSILLSVLQSQLAGGFVSIYFLLFLILSMFVYTKKFFALKKLKHPGRVGDIGMRNSQNRLNFVKKLN
jgi:K+ transporter